MKKITLFFIAIMSVVYVNAQWGIGGRVANKVKDHMADKAAEAIANKIISKWNEAEQEALQKDYDSIMQENPDAYDSFEDYKRSLNTNPNVQDAYHFDIWIDVESTEGKEKDQYQLYFSKDNAILGMKTMEDANAFTVIDYDRDIMVIYSEEEGEKNMQALPSFQRLAGTMVQHAAQEAEEEKNITFEKTGKTKTIAGYECEEYTGTNDDGPFMMYVATSFPISWDDVYGKFYSQYLIENNSEVFGLSGMMMQHFSMDKKGKVTSSWEVTQVNEDGYTIHTTDYMEE